MYAWWWAKSAPKWGILGFLAASVPEVPWLSGQGTLAMALPPHPGGSNLGVPAQAGGVGTAVKFSLFVRPRKINTKKQCIFFRKSGRKKHKKPCAILSMSTSLK